MMKTSLLAILLLALPLPVLSEDAADLAYEKAQAMRDAYSAKQKQFIREYYEAWLPANRAKLEDEMKTFTFDPKCRKGGYEKGFLKWGEYTKQSWKKGQTEPSLPERTDPMYLSWKQLRRQQYIADAFERSWGGMMEPTQWAKFQAEKIDSSEFRQWIADNLEVKSVSPYHVANLADGPNPEEWTADRVSPSGKSVDESGDVTIESATSSRSTHVRWFWIPFAIGFFLAVFFASKGTSPSLGFLIGYFGYGLLVGAMGPLGAAGGFKMVLMELLAAWIVFGIVILGIIKLALSGLGLKKDA